MFWLQNGRSEYFKNIKTRGRKEKKQCWKSAVSVCVGIWLLLIKVCLTALVHAVVEQIKWLHALCCTLACVCVCVCVSYMHLHACILVLGFFTLIFLYLANIIFMVIIIIKNNLKQHSVLKLCLYTYFRTLFSIVFSKVKKKIWANVVIMVIYSTFSPHKRWGNPCKDLHILKKSRERVENGGVLNR